MSHDARFKEQIPSAHPLAVEQAMAELQQLAFERSEKLGKFAVTFIGKLQDPLARDMSVNELEIEPAPIFDEVATDFQQTIS